MNHTATYSPEDNKLRIYAAHRLDSAEFAEVKAAGFRWAPRQELFYAPWSPAANDQALKMAGEIEDEDRSLIDRAEERADRFGEYADNRRRDGNAAHAQVDQIAKRFEGGQPILVGHHSERKARKDQEKMDRGMRNAIKAFETARYWTDRAAGAIRNAKYKERPDVRARRIKTIEADRRKQERAVEKYSRAAAAWTKYDPAKDPENQVAAHIANNSDIYASRCYPLADFPRDPPASQYEGQMGIWSALDGKVINGEQARDAMLGLCARAIAWANRWIEHYDNRLAYERAMLAAEGGTVTDKKGPEVGGAIQCLWAPRGGWAYIVKVNKVTVTVRHQWSSGGKVFRHNEPLDKITAVMTAAEVQAARDEGRLVETDNGVGFYLAAPKDPPAPEVAPEPEPQPEPVPAAEPEPSDEQKLAALKLARSDLRNTTIVVTPTLYPTPHAVADKMVRLANLDRLDNPRVLEPSAGSGHLIAAALRLGKPMDIEAVEISPKVVDALRTVYADKPVTIFAGDFMHYDVEPADRFDVILMNPPFDGMQDVKHIRRARRMLKPGGVLVAIAANGPRQREALQDLTTYWEEMPAGTFEGTNVRTVLMVIEGNGDGE